MNSSDRGQLPKHAARLTTAHRRRWREWPLGAVLLVGLVGVALVATQHVKRGSVVLGTALLLAAVLRAMLPAREVGLLAVRGRFFDVLWCGTLGAAIVVLAIVVPPR
jgi:hypothetical protein